MGKYMIEDMTTSIIAIAYGSHSLATLVRGNILGYLAKLRIN
jgi:hypothetical protein